MTDGGVRTKHPAGAVASRAGRPLSGERSPAISVVVVNFNRADLLRCCLGSLASQRRDDFEVVLVDNGSSDHSLRTAAEFENVFRFGLQIIENKSNLGFCAANNQGIARARGEFIALLNNDAEAEPDWLGVLVEALERRRDFGMAASKIMVYGSAAKIDKAGHLIYLDGQNRGRGTGEIDTGQYDREEEVLWPDGCAALYRRSMLDEIGYFDEDLFAYGDDADLGLRARIAGWKCIYVPGAVVRHHRGSTLGLLSSRRIELIERNRVLLAVKHFPLRLLIFNGVFWVARMAAGAWAALRGKGEAAAFHGRAHLVRLAMALIKGNLQAIGMLPATVRKRRALRSLRRLSESEICQLLFRYKISLRTLSEQAT